MAIHPLPLILASSSQSREMLLKQTGWQFSCMESKVDEAAIRKDNPLELVQTLAKAKGEVAAGKLENPALILAADTVVVWHNDVLEKPKYKMNAVEMIQKLQGDIHTVVTGWAVINSYKQTLFQGYSETYVKFRPLTHQEIVNYVDDNPVTRWAGGYNSQLSSAITFIEKVDGSLTGLNGLPLEQVVPVLRNEWLHPYKERKQSSNQEVK